MSKHHAKHLNNKRWRRLRRLIFKRDGYRCRTCGRLDRLECDHVQPLDAGDNMWNPDNLKRSADDTISTRRLARTGEHLVRTKSHGAKRLEKIARNRQRQRS